MVMADQGSDILHLLALKCVNLNIPFYLRGRAIEWEKKYRILHDVIPIFLHAELDEIWLI